MIDKMSPRKINARTKRDAIIIIVPAIAPRLKAANTAAKDSARYKIYFNPFLSYLRLFILNQSLSQNSALFTVLGKDTTSLILDMPVIYIISLSKPRPKPAWRVLPNLRRSRYQL